MRRRNFISGLGGAAVASLVAARAQQVAMPVIGFLAAAAPAPAMLTAFREGLRERGYIEGQNLSIHLSLAVRAESDIAAELVSNKVDVIVAWGTPAVIAARRATSTIPIVMVGVGDPRSEERRVGKECR